MKTKILHIVTTWLPQTMAWLYNQINLLPDSLENHIVCKQTKNLDQFELDNIISLNSAFLFKDVYQRSLVFSGLRRNYGFIESTIRNESPDIIHSHFGNVGWANALLAKKYNLSHIITFYGFDVNMLPTIKPIWKKRYIELFELSDLILCEGPYMAECISKLGCPIEKIKIQRLGIDVCKTPFRPRKRTDKKIIFLIAGTFREKKGIPIALSALAQLKKESFDFEIRIVGDASNDKKDVSEKNKIFKVLKENDMIATTRFLGLLPYSKFSEELYNCDIFISPSLTARDGDSEGGAPLTIIEAAATGMPIVSTYHCDIPNVLGETNRAYLVREKNIAELHKAIKRILDADWAEIGRNNREFIEKNHDQVELSLNLSSIYKSMTK